MIELTVKTLDARNHHFTVPSDYTVEQLKEHIAQTIQIPSEAQRCIYLGQVLQNEMKLSDCDVNGKVIHVVQRPPPSNVYENNDTPNANNSNSSNTTGPASGRRFEHTGTMYLGAMAFPSDIMDGGLTFLHPRTNLSITRIVGARNLLRRAVTIINQLENENYFSSNQEQANQSQSRTGTNNLAEDINNSASNTGLEQHDVEIRIEIPNVQHDSVAEAAVGTDDGIEIPEPTLSNESSSANQQPIIDDAATDTSANSQTENDNNATGGTNREDANRRRASRTPMMATVMGAVLHAQVRLIPFMRLLRQYLLQDTAFGPDMSTTHTEQQIQSLYNSVSELMHYFAHIYHSLSDIMCDFSQPPPRTLRCRPVILQQQHATVLRSTPRGRIIRSPVFAVSRSTSTAPPSETGTNGNTTTEPTETGAAENGESNLNAGTSAVEVVIEEADTTNMQDNHEEVIHESMDVSEPVGIEFPLNGSNNGRSSVTVRGQSGNTYLIQSMPDGLIPEGIRINSMEATILAPNDDVATALSNETNQRWRAGIVPAADIIGMLNQIRTSQRTSGSTAGSRSRQSNISSNSTENTPVNSNTANGENNQSQNNSTERSFELDITALSRTFDPFLPCHSHHVHPVVSRASGMRNSGIVRNTNTQSSSSNQSAQSSQAQQSSSQSVASELRQSSRETHAEQTVEDQRPQGQQSVRRNEEESGFRLTSNLTSIFSNIFPGFSIGNVMIRRGSSDANNAPFEPDARQSTRTRIQSGSNLNALFPGAIHIEIDPVTNNIQTNIVPNLNGTQTDSNNRSRRTRIASRRSRRVNSNVSGIANDERSRMSSSTSSTSTSSASPSPPTSSLSSSDDESMEPSPKTDRKNKSNETSPNKTVRHLFSMVKKENIRYLTSKAAETPKKETTNNFPLYVENQETSLLNVINAVINNTSFKEIIRDGKTNLSQLTTVIRQRIRNFLIESRVIISDNQKGYMNAVNILINNDLHRMKSLLDSDCVKQEIDLVSTICKFNQDSVPELIEHIIAFEDLNDNDLKKFCKHFHFYIARLLTLFIHCISGDDKSMQIRKVLGAVIEEIIKSLPKDEELVHWLRKDLINHVISYSKISHPDNLPAFMRHYVVYRLPPVMPVECTVATATITNIGESDIANQPQPMEVEDTIQSSSSSESSFVSANSDVPQVVPEQIANTAPINENNSSQLSVPVVSPTEQFPEVVLNSEEWHRTFPSEWVPIITRDIHRLRRQGSQPPFSDAYLSGMPTKRRKLIKKSKPDLQASSQLITDNISTSMNAAGFSASVNTITNHVAETNTSGGNLSEIVKEELKENVRENMVQQSEFLPHRFPDSTKYFMDK